MCESQQQNVQQQKIVSKFNLHKVHLDAELQFMEERGLEVTLVFIIDDLTLASGLTEINWTSQNRLFRIVFSLFSATKAIS